MASRRRNRKRAGHLGARAAHQGQRGLRQPDHPAVSGIIVAELDGRNPVIDWRDGEYLPKGQDAYPLLFDSPVALTPATFDDCTDVDPALWSGRLAEHPVDVISKDFLNDHSNPFI